MFHTKQRINKKIIPKNYLNDVVIMDDKILNRGKNAAARNINVIEYWQHFKKKLSTDKTFNEILKSEKNILSKSILNISNMFEIPTKKR